MSIIAAIVGAALGTFGAGVVAIWTVRRTVEHDRAMLREERAIPTAEQLLDGLERFIVEVLPVGDNPMIKHAEVQAIVDRPYQAFRRLLPSSAIAERFEARYDAFHHSELELYERAHTTDPQTWQFHELQVAGRGRAEALRDAVSDWLRDTTAT